MPSSKVSPGPAPKATRILVKTTTEDPPELSQNKRSFDWETGDSPSNNLQQLPQPHRLFLEDTPLKSSGLEETQPSRHSSGKASNNSRTFRLSGSLGSWLFPNNPFQEYMDDISKRVVFVWFVRALLRGLSQVIFVQNSVTGLFVIAAAFYNSVFFATMGMVGLIASTLAACALKVQKQDIGFGLYGYNGYLAGTAVALFQVAGSDSQWSSTLYIPAVICGMGSTVFMVALTQIALGAKQPMSAFTFPFHFVTWIWLLGAQQYRYFPNSLADPSLVTQTTAAVRSFDSPDIMDLLEAVPIGVGQVFFFSDFYSGVILIAGMIIGSPIAAVASLFGSAIGSGTAVLLGVPDEEIYAGLWAYNPTLVVVALGGSIFYHLNCSLTGIAFAGGAFTTIIHGAVKSVLSPIGMPVITFPAAFGCALFFTLCNGLPHIKAIKKAKPRTLHTHQILPY